MQEVDITSLVPVAFNQPGGLPLNYLELSLNNITELFADTFYGLPKLTTLNLYKNNIMTINVTAFRGKGFKMMIARSSHSSLLCSDFRFEGYECRCY